MIVVDVLTRGGPLVSTPPPFLCLDAMYLVEQGCCCHLLSTCVMACGVLRLVGGFLASRVIEWHCFSV